MTGTELGRAVAAIYGEAMRATTALLNRGGKVGVLHEELLELKHDTIDQLLELGRQRLALSQAEREAADKTLRLELQLFPKADFQSYVDALNTLGGKAHDTYELAASINVITQYADFELLETQTPDEAKRLGVDAESRSEL